MRAHIYWRAWLLGSLILLAACAGQETDAATSVVVDPEGPAAQEVTSPAEPLRGTYPRVSGLELAGLRESAPPFEIRYTLDAPARVRLRLVDRDSPGVILRTLLEWEERAAGLQVERWDGLDAHGEVANPRAISLALVAEPALAAGPGQAQMWDRQALLALRLPEHKHWTHDPERCRDLDVTLTSPPDGSTLQGTVHVCTALGESRGMPEGEYHVVLYLDGRTAWDGRLPEGTLCQTWDTTSVPDGTYRLAVTWNDLHDHAGSDWVTIVVRNSE